MSEQTWQVRAQVPPVLQPATLIGAASPLWGYFTGAAMAGVTWWWMSRMFSPLAASAVLGEGAGETERAQQAVVAALVGDDLPEIPVGGEAAPFGPVTLKAEVADADAAPVAPLAIEPGRKAKIVTGAEAR